VICGGHGAMRNAYTILIGITKENRQLPILKLKGEGRKIIT
jgi:hypothetical protein